MPISPRVLINLLARDKRQINTDTSQRTAIITTVDREINIISTLLFIYYYEYI